MAQRFRDTPDLRVPPTLVRKFRLERETPAGVRETLGEFDNHQRLRKIPLDCDAVALRLTILATGSGAAERVFAWDVE